jgi:cation transport ATPase
LNTFGINYLSKGSANKSMTSDEGLLHEFVYHQSKQVLQIELFLIILCVGLFTFMVYSPASDMPYCVQNQTQISNEWKYNCNAEASMLLSIMLAVSFFFLGAFLTVPFGIPNDKRDIHKEFKRFAKRINTAVTFLWIGVIFFTGIFIFAFALAALQKQISTLVILWLAMMGLAVIYSIWRRIGKKGRE